jgi:uncharacterized protein (TIGR02452 family)
MQHTLDIDGKVMISQIRGGQIQFSIETKDAEKLLQYFKTIPSYNEGLHLKEQTIEGKYTKLGLESFFRLRLLAHLYLRDKEREDTFKIADLIDKMTGVNAEYSQIKYLSEVLNDFQWNPDLFMMLHEEALLCSHVRKLVQAHTIVHLSKQAKEFKPGKAVAMVIEDKRTSVGHSLDCVLEVLPKDCLVAARELVNAGHSVCLLNMANQHIPGGGYATGAGAQEEDLCRRTDLLKSLPGKYPDKDNGFGEFTVLRSTQVTVFREGQAEGYAFCKPFQLNVVSSAAYNLSHEKKRTYKDPKNDDYAEGMKRKIRGQLRAAEEMGDRCLVLSAFGCGAFHNDAAKVAQFYLEVLHEKEFEGVFDIIQFAVIPNSSETNNDNYSKFLEAFKDKGLKREDLKVEVYAM